MKNFWQKIKGLRSLIKISSTFYFRKGIRPLQHWKMIVLTGIIVLFVEVLFGAYLYSGIKTGSIFTVQNDENIGQVTLNSSLLKKMADESRTRKSIFDEIRQGGNIPGDPSN